MPHSEFSRLRREAPVAWADHPGGHRGFWVVSGYDDVVSILRDPSTFSSRGGVITLEDLDEHQLEARRTMLEEDPPRHRLLRNLTAAHFTPRAVRAYESFVRSLAASAIEEAIANSPSDLVTVLSEKVPIRVLAKILGVPDEMVDELVSWGNQMIGADDPEYETETPDDSEASRLLPFGHPAAARAFDMAWKLAGDRRLSPGEDVMSALALGDLDGSPLSRDELGTYFVLLVIAGNETTRHTITSGVMALASESAQWEKLRDGAISSSVAADEVIRSATAIHFHRRVATRPVTLGEVEIGSGDKVALYFASANFDESRFDHPHQLDLERSPNPHVSFGRGGPHFCLGAHLARLEVGVVLEELARRVRQIEILGEPQRLRSNHINGIKHLEVNLHPN
ncbi:MAG: cytochrome P450 [Acidimicrobiia bacterium]